MHKINMLSVAIVTSFALTLPINTALTQQQKKGDWISSPKPWGHTELQNMADWVNGTCGPDASGIQGFVNETAELGDNWEVYVFCRINAPGKTKWRSDNRGSKEEPVNLSDMAASIQLGKLAIVGNVRGQSNTTILVLVK